jgi:16S rRNA (cytosine1402-N4)-methyltransferase
MYHKPVLLEESIEGLAIKPDGVYVDGTYGGGGHSSAILEKAPKGRLIAFDQDEEALVNKIDDERLTLINHNFRYLKNFLKYHNAVPVDGILVDLGVSSHQFDSVTRGFSMRHDAGLDMRMNRRQSKTATMILNEYPENELKNIFRQYGELDEAHAIVTAIIRKRATQYITTFRQLEQTIGHLAHRGQENKFFARVLQALRIELNQEIEALKDFLLQAADVLKVGGRLVIISYHSLEDRIAKNFIKSGNLDGIIEKDFFGNESRIFKAINKKPIVPSDSEITENSRSRSAKLRIAEKI